MSRDLRQLVGKLGPACRKSLERAAAACVSATHHSVELEHLIVELMRPPAADWPAILRHYGIATDAVEADLRRSMEGFARGSGRTPPLSPRILDAIEEAWVVTSVNLGAASIRSGALLLAMLTRDACRAALIDGCPQLLKVPREHLAENLKAILGAVAEDAGPGAGPGVPTDETGIPKGGALDQYTSDLTALARAGKIDPIHGRDGEIRQIVDILMRRRQNNPILTGEPGVGKTAVVEGFAQRVADGDVPEPLRTVVVRALDVGLLQAGAGMKGEFEQRLKSVIAEVAAAPVPVILFVDEAHTLIGAGGAAGQGDAANLLKPALARGELRTIAATTWGEYKRYFEKDAALARRFQVVKVEEPDDRAAVLMVRGVTAKLEAHHGVRVSEDAVAAAVSLSSRYVSGRQQPDKALSVLDTACARVAVARDATPPPIEAATRRLDAIATETARLEREAGEGTDHADRLTALDEEAAALEAERTDLIARWTLERARAADIRAILAGTVDDAARSRLALLRADLAAIQGAAPMVPVEVDGRTVAEVVAAWTGIPVGRMMRDEVGAVLDVEGRVAGRVVGQEPAVATIARRLRTWRAGLAEAGKPAGVFLLCGPTGVGKTETALALADLLYGGERGLTVINMSEFQEPHTVALLKGAPPGYVGYGQGGILTEAVRRQPYSVVLLDEIEKAHPDVTDLFYQLFDKGRLEDAEGVEVDFRHSLVVMTTNLGAETIEAACPPGGVLPRPDADALAELIRPDLARRFKPAFLARCTIVPYLPLGPETVARVVGLKLARVAARLGESHRASVTLSPAVERAIIDRCLAAERGGARLVDQVLENTLLPELSTLILAKLARGEPFDAVTVDLDDAGRMAFRFAYGRP
jgi:type VI secretion system protein VasG